MADNRTMAEMLCAPTEGNSLDSKRTIRMITFVGAARWWLEKEPTHFITTWNDLVSKFINEFFPPSRTTNLRNEISNFHQKFDESFHEAWERYKDLLHACPHHGFTKLHQLDTFYNALNPADQDSLNAAAGGNLLEKGSLPSNTVANPKGELKAITTRSGLVTDGPTVPTPSKSVTPEVGERVEETYTDPDLAEYTIKVPPPPIQKYKPPSQRDFAVILKKLPEKLGDPGKFLIPCSFSKLKCKALVNLGASINLMPLSVWKELGRPFLRTDRALIDVHGKEMILRDGDERLTLNMKHDTASYSNNPPRESVNLINIFNVSSEDFLEVSVSNQTSGNPTFSLHQELTSSEVTHEIHDSEGCNFLSASLDIDSINDIHPHFDDDPLSGGTTYSANSLLEEFTDELALITYPLDYDDNLQFDIESDLKEIEFLLYQVESDTDNIFDDPFDSKGEKIKESKLLIDELDLSCNFLPYFEYDSFDSQDFSKVDALPSTKNEEKVFNLGILIQEESVKIITRVVQEKKPARSSASLVLEDFDPSFYEPFVFKDVPKSKMLLPFSSENEEKVFKPGIYTYGKVKERQEKDKIRTKQDKKGKRGKARQCRRPITVKKAGKKKKIQV
nr:reverse transcriptase domain-containing protein [Tanacetum cinerariifolium]